MGENATIPPRIGRQRTVASTSWFILCTFGSFNTNIYFIPILPSCQKHERGGFGYAYDSLIVANVITILVTGILSAKVGHYVPFFYACSIISSIGYRLSNLVETPCHSDLGIPGVVRDLPNQPG